MRVVVAFLLALVVGPVAGASGLCQDPLANASGLCGEPAPAQRQGIDPDLKTFPQGTPQEALASVLKAIEGKRVDYLLAHLADPEWVDQRLKDTGGKLNELRQETTRRLVDDPGAAKQLQRLLKEGEWDLEETDASVHLKEATDRWVFLHKSNGRWFLENRWKPERSR
jgi:hypothetical protein